MSVRPLSGSDILENARALAEGVREKDLAAEYDRLRQLPVDIVNQIRDAGIMRMNMPKIWGGPEMSSMEQIEVIEALARADASIAWCSFIWCDSGRERTFSLLESPKREGVIWARPDAFLRKMSGVPLGVAADAIETARVMLSDKVDRLSGVPYRETARVQSAMAEAQSLLGAARSYVFTSLENVWRKLERGEPLTERERADAWLSRTHAFQAGRRVVSVLYDTIGGSAIYSKKSPFDRHLRDMQTACQHVAEQTKGWEGVGALLLGAEGNYAML